MNKKNNFRHSKILLVTPRFPPDVGGVAQAVWRQAQQLSNQGHTVSVWVNSPGLHPESPPCEVLRFRSVEETNPILILKKLEEAPPDLIHAYYLSATAHLSLELGKAFKIPVILSARGNDLDRDLWFPHKRSELLSWLPQAQGLSGVTQALTKKLKVLVPQNECIRWVPNSVDPLKFKPLPREKAIAKKFKIPTQGQRLGFVGELRQKKGEAILLLSFATLAKEFPELSLILIGTVRSGKDSELLKIFLSQNPELKNRIFHIPNQAPGDLPPLYAWLDGVLFPSLQEGLSNAALEALSCARPVIATEVGGFPDLIHTGQEGQLILPYQTEALIEACRELLKNPEQGKAWGKAGRKKIKAYFSPEQELQNWLTLYSEVLAQF